MTRSSARLRIALGRPVRVAAALMLSSAFVAPALVQAGPITLEGGFIRIGLNDSGTLGSGGNTSPGILYDGTGKGSFNPANDYLTPGSPFEGFTLTGSAGGSGFTLTNNNGGGAGVTGTLVDQSGVAVGGATLDKRGIWTGSAKGVVSVVNDVAFNVADQRVAITTTITALSDVTGLKFARFIDPDAVAAPGDSSSTRNVIGAKGIPTTDLVYAEATTSKYVIGLYTDSKVTHNAAVTMWSSNPSDYTSGTNVGDGDVTIGLGFDIGALANGESVTLKYSYVFGTDIAAAVSSGGLGGGGGGMPDIDKSWTMSQANGAAVNPVFKGGTLVAEPGSSTLNFTIAGAGGTIDQAGAHATFSGTFTDAAPGTAGGLTIVNSGKGGSITLSGANTHTGPTTINGAQVHVNGSLAGQVIVNAGGMLRGTGIMGGVAVGAGGVLAPGNSPGTLASAGSVTLAAGSTTVFDIDGTGTGSGAGNFSRIIVFGAGNTLTAGGTVAPTLRGISGSATNSFTPVVGQAFRVVLAQGGVLGAFSGLAQPVGLAANTRFDVVYGASTIDLVVTPAQFGGVADWSSPMGAALDAVRPAAGANGSAVQAAVFGPIYGLTTAQMLENQRQLAPMIYADTLSAQRTAFHAATGSVGGELSARRGGVAQAGGQAVTTALGTTFWMQGSGTTQRTTNGPGNTPGNTVQGGGATVGVDTLALPGVRLGVAVGVAHQVVRAGNGGQHKGEVGHLTAYGSYSLGMGAWGLGFIDAQASLLAAQGQASRQLSLYGATSRGDTGSLGAGGQVKGGVRVDVAGWQVEPSVAFSALRLHPGGLKE